MEITGQNFDHFFLNFKTLLKLRKMVQKTDRSHLLYTTYIVN